MPNLDGRRVAEIEATIFGMAIRDAVFPVSTIFSLYYVVAASAHVVVQEGLAQQVIPVMSLFTSVLFFLQGLRWRRAVPGVDRTVSWFVTILSLNNLVVLTLTGQADAFFGQLIAQIGLGLVGVSWPAFFGLSVVIAAPVVAGSVAGPGIQMTGSGALLYGSAFLLAYVSQLLSTRFRERLAGAQAESERQRQAAETNLSRFREEASRREQLQERLAHADRLESLGILAGGVAHDFNNLLAVIIGRTSALQEQALPGELKAEVDAVLEAAERAALLSRELLAYAGRSAQVAAPVDLRREVSAVGRLARSTLPQGVELLLQEDRTPEVVLADRSQIQQIVLNLLMNAGDAMREQGGTIRVRVGHAALDQERASLLEPPQVRQAGDYAFIRVEDQGVGMSAEIRKHIFDPFFSTKPAGRGLGLAAALGIARVHGGGFEVMSELGKGSCFTLYLPSSDAELPAVEAPPARPAPKARPRVLVIDDQSQVREMVTTVLERCGYRTLAASGGREGVGLLMAEPDDVALAIVDMSMPDMDGEATFHALRAVREGLPVLLSSGFDAHETAARLAHSQHVGFLQKPYRLVELQTRVEELLRSG